jgi:hypothetical protein
MLAQYIPQSSQGIDLNLTHTLSGETDLATNLSEGFLLMMQQTKASN